jgi:hypothetical protein
LGVTAAAAAARCRLQETAIAFFEKRASQKLFGLAGFGILNSDFRFAGNGCSSLQEAGNRKGLV